MELQRKIELSPNDRPPGSNASLITLGTDSRQTGHNPIPGPWGVFSYRYGLSGFFRRWKRASAIWHESKIVPTGFGA